MYTECFFGGMNDLEGPYSENTQLDCSSRRRSTRLSEDKLKVKLPFPRKPLGDVNVNCSVNEKSVQTDSTVKIMPEILPCKENSPLKGDCAKDKEDLRPSYCSVDWTLDKYSDFLKTIMPGDLFLMLRRDVLDKVTSGK